MYESVVDILISLFVGVVAVFLLRAFLFDSAPCVNVAVFKVSVFVVDFHRCVCCDGVCLIDRHGLCMCTPTTHSPQADLVLLGVALKLWSRMCGSLSSFCMVFW